MNIIQKIAVLYLFAMGFMAWGFAVSEYEVFPYSLLKDVKSFVVGHELGLRTTILDKFINDLGVEPRRHMRNYPEIAVRSTRVLDVPGMNSRRNQPLVYIEPGSKEGYRVIFGALDFEAAFWGGLLLDHTGSVIHTWKLSTDHLPTSKTHQELKNLYGVQVYPDGSVIFTQQERGGGIVKVDACSKPVWDLPGNFHHTITPTDEGYFWTFTGMQEEFDQDLARVSVDTGEILSVIEMEKVREANPFVFIFDLQASRENNDVSHGNDIEPLSRELADKFPQFSEGDLLISYRTHNLLFVLDPDSLKIKWWRVGAWDRQHDPDWESDGTISVFSNNAVAERKYSDIIKVQPQTQDYDIVINGENYDFYSSVNGDQQRTSFNTRMVSSTTQGWDFEVDDKGQIVFSFVNAYSSKERKSLNVSEAERLNDDYFKEDFWKKCTS